MNRQKKDALKPLIQESSPPWFEKSFKLTVCQSESFYGTLNGENTVLFENLGRNCSVAAMQYIYFHPRK